MTIRYAVATPNNESDIGFPQGGKTPVACSTTSTRVVTMKMNSRPTTTAPMERSVWRGGFVSFMTFPPSPQLCRVVALGKQHYPVEIAASLFSEKRIKLHF